VSSRPVLDRLSWAVEALRSLGQGGQGKTDETPEGFVFTREVQAQHVGGLGELLAELATAGFSLDLKIHCRDSLWPLTLRAGTQGLAATVGKKEEVPDSLKPLSEEALEAVGKLEDLLATGARVAFADVAVRVNEVAVQNVPVDATLTVSLKKRAVNEEIQASTLSRDANVITFLSSGKLAELLKTASLEVLEEQFFTAGSRTVFVVPGMAGYLSGDLLGVFGWDRAAELDAFLEKGLPTEARTRAEEVRGFCDWQCDWEGRPQWLTPETFWLPRSSGSGDAGRTALEEQLERLQSLLCILFLARRTRRDGAGSYEVNFGQSPGDAFAFLPAGAKAPSKEFSDRLFDLYKFSYDGSFAEKLELVRQFLAPHVQDLASLFRNTRMALQASQKAHERYLTKKVDEYFEAQRKSREYIQEAVRDGEKSIMDMSQEVAESVYKTFGAVALVVVAQALDTKVSAPAGLVAAVVLTVYLLAVVFFYLPTVRKAQEVREKQFEDHIESFRPVLTEDEVTELRENERVQQAWNDFETKRTWAAGIYVSLLVLSAAAMVFYLWRVVS